MSPQTWRRVKQLYADACQLPPSQRSDYLRLQAAEEPRVLAETLRLLRYEGEDRIEELRMPSSLPQPRRSGLLFPGQVLGERYEVVRFLAAGGFGEVYAAEDRERGERVALKILRPEFSGADQVSWIRREVQMARRIQHPNVCRVFDVVQAPEGVFLTMELLEGETLAAYLKREGALTERRATPILRQIVAALAAAHQNGVVHRDLKPGNIMLVPRADGPPRAVVTDFGLARPAQSERRTTISASASAAFGTPAYMAPEQIAGKNASAAADIYALGVLLHEMMTGELPFNDESPLTMAVRKLERPPGSPLDYAPALRPTWVSAINRCLEPKPARRFQDARDVLKHLDSRSPAALKWKLARRWIRRRVTARSLIAVAACAAIAAAFWIAFPAKPSSEGMAAWQQGIYRLHAGEPLEAIRLWEQAAKRHRLPGRLDADVALAWHQLNFASRAAVSQPNLILASEEEGLYRQAVRAWIAGDTAGAMTAVRRRATLHPQAPDLAADLAHLESLVTAKPSPVWRRVAELKPQHPAAHLQLASIAAGAGNWTVAEREYLTAQTYFQSLGDREMTRAVAARRGMRLLQSGDSGSARNDLLPFVAAPPAGSGAGPCERMLSMMAGSEDDFARPLDEIPYRSPSFERYGPAAGGARLTGFDDNAPDREILLSFPLPPVRICSAQIEYRVRRDLNNVATENDFLVAGAAPFESAFAPLSRPLWASNPRDSEGTYTVELRPELFANIQRAYADQPVASLDIHVGDDTSLDYIKLTLVY